jgi:hypothetical protein
LLLAPPSHQGRSTVTEALQTICQEPQVHGCPAREKSIPDRYIKIV